MSGNEPSRPQLEQIEKLIQHLERAGDSATRDAALELVQLVMEWHRSGLERLIEVVTQPASPNAGVVLRLADDELVSGLLLLHGLHPLDLSQRVNRALDKVRPYLKSHGGNVELLGIDEDSVVRLRLQGSCHGCPSSAMTLKLAIEEAIIEFAPDAARLEVEGVVSQQPAAFNPLPILGNAAMDEAASPPSSGWEEVVGLKELREGEIQIRDVGGQDVLFLRAGSELYAYQKECARCGQSLASSTLAASVLTCPGCDAQFDIIRAGRCLDVPALHLEPLPLLVAKGRTRIALAVSS